MLDRAQVIDAQFIDFLRKNAPHLHNPNTPISIDIGTFREIFNSQMQSRHLDLYARKLKDMGQGYYSIGSSGHEGNAAIAAAFKKTDPAFLHYRDCAFYLQRAKRDLDIDPVYDTLLSLVASIDDPISSGRHKVLGSVPLNIPPQTSTIASHLPKALGSALAIEKANALGLSLPIPKDSVVLCSFGDASLNHAVAQATINACEWWFYQNVSIPIVFICEDNGIGISVSTPKHWVEDLMTGKPCINYLQANGLDISETFEVAQQAEKIAREKREPVFLHMKCVRLMGHAGSDVEFQYRTQEEVEANEACDPLIVSASAMMNENIATPEEILEQYEKIRKEVLKKADQALATKKLSNKEDIMRPLVSTHKKHSTHSIGNDLTRREIFANAYDQLTMQRNLSQNINFALMDLMIQYPEIILMGEDIGKKGGVYRVTAGLQERFGKKRVMDTLLDETIILGTAIGYSQMGFIPIPEIQFLAYYHNAQDQIRGEAATLSFFSNGQMTNPMVVRIAGLAYQKGFGGHFHNDNSFTALRDVPGIVIACPSRGADAAQMLRECVRLAYEERRVVIFLEPIALYMTKDIEKGDNAWLDVYPDPNKRFKFGEPGIEGISKDYLIITYGNGRYLAKQAEAVLKSHKIQVKIMDLRWLKPLPEKQILKEVKEAKHVLIVDECRRTGSVSEEIITLLVEQLGGRNLPKIKRITGEDSFIPIGESWQYVLPSSEDIVDAIMAWAKENESNKIA